MTKKFEEEFGNLNKKYGYYNIHNRNDRVCPSNNDDWEEVVNKIYNGLSNKIYMRKYFKYFLNDTNLIVLDFDNHTENGLTLDKIYESFPFLKNNYYTMSKNGKGYHFYITSEDKYINIKKKLNCNPDSNFDIDFLPDIIEETEDSQLYGEKLTFVTEEQIIKIFPEINKHIKNITFNNMPKDIQQKIYNINNAEIIELLNILKNERADDYDSWYQVVGALKSIDLEDVARQFSMKSSKYSQVDFDSFYQKQTHLSVGIIYNMAKEDNFNKYRQIRNKYKYDGLILFSQDFISNLSISEKISDYLKNQLVFCNKKWYAVKENLWCQDVEPTLYIYKCIEAGTQKGIEKINYQINQLTDQDEIGKKAQERELLLKNRKKIDTSSTMGQIIKCLKELLTDNEFDNILDKQPYKIAFKNGIYDVTKKEDNFREGIDSTDYLTKTLDFNYTEDMANEEDGYWLSNQLYKLCNCDESQKEYFMSIISYCLCGDSSKHQHFYGAIGQKAGNGKSTIISILSKIMPCYVKVGNSQMLESDFKNKHKFLPDLERYRLVAFEEMRKGKKIDTRIFKTIADGMVIDNEVMFGTNKKINVNSKCILISNHTPDFDEPDEGANRRYTHFQFDSEFRPEYKTDDYENKKFIAINNIEEEFIKRKETLIWFILQLAHEVYHKGLPEIPEYYKDEKKEIMDSNFVFKTFVSEFCEIGEGYRISKKELVEKYYIEKNIKIDEKTLRDEMKGLGYEYKRKLRGGNDKSQGVFIGLRIKEDSCYLNESDLDSD